MKTASNSIKKKFTRVLPWVLFGTVAVPVSVMLFSFIKGDGIRITDSNKSSNKTAGYFISFKSPERSNVQMAFFKITGGAHQLCSSTGSVDGDFSKERITTHVYAMPSGKLTSTELMKRLTGVQDLYDLNVVEISKLILPTELYQVRQLFHAVNWDFSRVGDDTLSLFIIDKLKGKYTYYLNPVPEANEFGKSYVEIKPLKDHPQYEMLMKHEADMKKKKRSKYDSDTIIVQEVVLEEIDVDFPEPPPTPPVNIRVMTDAQIKEMIKNSDSRKIKDEDITIKRSSTEIEITIMIDRKKEMITYPLPKQ